MKKLSFLLLFATAFVLCSCNDDDKNIKIEKVTNFDALISAPESDYVPTSGEETESGSKKTYIRDSEQLVECDHYFADWGFGGGITCSNKSDKSTPGYTNNSAITAKAKEGSVYLTVNSSTFSPAIVTNLKADEFQFKGAWITNSTYAYLDRKSVV